ncbi:hypothetical protein ACFQ07_30235, partial [Actinomadura adrarensis]
PVSSATSPTPTPTRSVIRGDGKCEAHGSGECRVEATGNPTSGTKVQCTGGGRGNGGGECRVGVGPKD